MHQPLAILEGVHCAVMILGLAVISMSAAETAGMAAGVGTSPLTAVTTSASVPAADSVGEAAGGAADGASVLESMEAAASSRAAGMAAGAGAAAASGAAPIAAIAAVAASADGRTSAVARRELLSATAAAEDWRSRPAAAVNGPGAFAPNGPALSAGAAMPRGDAAASPLLPKASCLLFHDSMRRSCWLMERQGAGGWPPPLRSDRSPAVPAAAATEVL